MLSLFTAVVLFMITPGGTFTPPRAQELMKFDTLAHCEQAIHDLKDSAGANLVCIEGVVVTK